jgi:hypothetical protein
MFSQDLILEYVTKICRRASNFLTSGKQQRALHLESVSVSELISSTTWRMFAGAKNVTSLPEKSCRQKETSVLCITPFLRKSWSFQDNWTKYFFNLYATPQAPELLRYSYISCSLPTLTIRNNPRSSYFQGRRQVFIWGDHYILQTSTKTATSTVSVHGKDNWQYALHPRQLPLHVPCEGSITIVGEVQKWSSHENVAGWRLWKVNKLFLASPLDKGECSASPSGRLNPLLNWKHNSWVLLNLKTFSPCAGNAPWNSRMTCGRILQRRGLRYCTTIEFYWWDQVKAN